AVYATGGICAVFVFWNPPHISIGPTFQFGMTRFCKGFFVASLFNILYSLRGEKLFTFMISVIAKQFPKTTQIAKSGIETSAGEGNSLSINLVISILFHPYFTPDAF